MKAESTGRFMVYDWNGKKTGRKEGALGVRNSKLGIGGGAVRE